MSDTTPRRGLGIAHGGIGLGALEPGLRTVGREDQRRVEILQRLLIGAGGEVARAPPQQQHGGR